MPLLLLESVPSCHERNLHIVPLTHVAELITNLSVPVVFSAPEAHWSSQFHLSWPRAGSCLYMFTSWSFEYWKCVSINTGHRKLATLTSSHVQPPSSSCLPPSWNRQRNVTLSNGRSTVIMCQSTQRAQCCCERVMVGCDHDS